MTIEYETSRVKPNTGDQMSHKSSISQKPDPSHVL